MTITFRRTLPLAAGLLAGLAVLAAPDRAPAADGASDCRVRVRYSEWTGTRDKECRIFGWDAHCGEVEVARRRLSLRMKAPVSVVGAAAYTEGLPVVVSLEDTTEFPAESLDFDASSLYYFPDRNIRGSTVRFWDDDAPGLRNSLRLRWDDGIFDLKLRSARRWAPPRTPDILVTVGDTTLRFEVPLTPNEWGAFSVRGWGVAEAE